MIEKQLDNDENIQEIVSEEGNISEDSSVVSVERVVEHDSEED